MSWQRCTWNHQHMEFATFRDSRRPCAPVRPRAPLWFIPVAHKVQWVMICLRHIHVMWWLISYKCAHIALASWYLDLVWICFDWEFNGPGTVHSLTRYSHKYYIHIKCAYAVCISRRYARTWWHACNCISCSALTQPHISRSNHVLISLSC